jgi:hypothetical protein
MSIAGLIFWMYLNVFIMDGESVVRVQERDEL